MDYELDETICPKCQKVPTRHRNCPVCETSGLVKTYDPTIYYVGEGRDLCSVCLGTGLEHFCSHCGEVFWGPVTPESITD